MVLTKPCNKSVAHLLVFLFLGCFPVGSLCQSTKANGVREKTPLRYRLIVSRSSVCPNEAITLELELENVSNHKVLIDPRGLLHNVDISRTGGAIVPRGDVMGKITQDQVVALGPGKSFRKTLVYPLQDSFFTVMGLYSIKVTYGQFAHPSPALRDLYIGVVESNVVLFEIRDCEDNR